MLEDTGVALFVKSYCNLDRLPKAAYYNNVIISMFIQVASSFVSHSNWLTAKNSINVLHSI